MPFRLCLTTSFDDFLGSAFRGAGKEPEQRFFNFKGSHEQVLESTGSPKDPLLYQLYGCRQKPDSMVLTEDDLISYLIKVVKYGFPKNLVETLRDKNTVFLFLGLGLYHWHLRILLRLLDETRSKDNPSFAFEDRHTFRTGGTVSALSREQARVFYKLGGHKIHLSDHSPDEMVEKLLEKITTSDPPDEVEPPPGPKPLAFLSYCHRDKDRLEKLEGRQSFSLSGNTVV